MHLRATDFAVITEVNTRLTIEDSKISGSYGGEHEDDSLLGYFAV
jgi:hypothetical protein